MNSLDFLEAELSDLESRHQRRRLRVASQAEGSRLTVEDQPLLNFSSNDYLGLSRHPQVVEAVKEVLNHWGTGAASSRLISGTTIIHEDLERALAAFMSKESALLFPTGYMANLGVITSLVGEGDAVILDRLCHASLIDGAKLSGARLFVYKHADASDAEKVLERAASYRRRLLVTESLFSMDGDFAPLPELAAAAKRRQAISLVDEAHAIGVWGTHGRGALGMDGKSSDWDIVIGTLSKALGSQGGFVTGSKDLTELLVNRARSFIYTTGLSPACVAAAQAALSVIQEEPALRQAAQTLSVRLREGLQAQGWNTLGSASQIVPVLLGDPEKALACSEHLRRGGVYAPAIRPPTVPAGECRIRFSVCAAHGERDIDQVLSAMRDFGGKP